MLHTSRGDNSVIWSLNVRRSSLESKAAEVIEGPGPEPEVDDKPEPEVVAELAPLQEEYRS